MEHIAALDKLQKLLEPLEFVVWGEAAMANLGVPLIPHVSRISAIELTDIAFVSNAGLELFISLF